jgi:hypothetical protein
MAREGGLAGPALTTLLEADLEWCRWELDRVTEQIAALDPVRDRGRLLEHDRERWQARIRRLERAIEDEQP